MANEFFLIFLVTILAIRIFLWVRPTPAPTVGTFRTHHWMFGVALILIALAIHSLILYAIGLGLFVNELAYLLMGGKTHQDNYSMRSLSGLIFFIILVYIFKAQAILLFALKKG